VATSPFLDRPPTEWLASNALAFALPDAFPVSPGHTLVIPRRLVPTWFDATHEEQNAILELVADVKRLIDAERHPDGYNVGFNAGAAAGQTVMHLHVHVIPRYRGDMDDPRGGVRGVIPSKQKYASLTAPRSGGSPFAELPRFVHGDDRHFAESLRLALRHAERADLVAAFVQTSGLRVLLDDVRDALARGVSIRLVTGDYLGVTSPDALRQLLRLADEHPAFSPFFYEVAQGQAFHPKAYLFHSGSHGIAYVGSSNLSESALTNGVEWNLQLVSSEDAATFGDIERRFEALLASPCTKPLTRELIDRYELRVPERPAPSPEPRAPLPTPTPLQREALEALKAARRQGKTRGLVVLATGLGKTFLSAFDFQNMGGERVLFVAHREEILDQAKDTWQRVFPDKVVGTYQGGKRERDVDIVFASVQTLARERHLAHFTPNHFDYVVIDEFHHAAAKTYRKILGHFTPRFLLGLTATPDRTDGKSLLELCGDNLIYRRNLVHGISQRLLVPFHYFALKDSVNYEPIPWRSGKFEPGALTAAVSTEEHAEQALAEYERRAAAGVRRTLCFCCTVEHADFTAAFFVRHGKKAVAVHSGPTSAPRADSLRKLKSGELEILCAVDVFNEGLDVPDINTVLMLRPTESPVIFLQQLGRGLRRADGKDALVVVDFIGNDRSFLSKPQSLMFLLGQDLPPRVALDKLRAGTLDLPDGCTVEIETEALDLLASMVKESKEDIAVYEYMTFRDTHGRRPTAAELFAQGVGFKAIRDRYESWFHFVDGQRDLTADEARVLVPRFYGMEG
jgi:superfamily II DNA or RNA helicase/diadenosine tetraphosphate (Ap4A) HIT family hydrolase